MLHKEKSPLAGQVVKVKQNVKHPQIDSFGGSDFEVEDWWDRVAGKSWMVCDGNPACLIYAMRTGFGKEAIPNDDEVLYGKIGHLGHLIHISELE